MEMALSLMISFGMLVAFIMSIYKSVSARLGTYKLEEF